MIRKTVVSTLVAGVALTGFAQAANAATPAAAAKAKAKYEACGKGETAKSGKCVKSAKRKVSGTVNFGSSTVLTGTAVNKTKGSFDVVVGFYWKANKKNQHKTWPLPVKAGKTISIGKAVPVNKAMVQKVTVQICTGKKAKRVCGAKKTVRP